MKLMTVLLSVAMLLTCMVMAGAVTPTVKSEGTVAGTGSGTAHARIFQGTVTVSGSGTLHVSAKAQVTLANGATGEKVTKTSKNGKQTWVVYKKFSGSATITGQDVHVTLRGKNITLTATGAGRAHFIGQGTFTLTNAGQSEKKGVWKARPPKGQTQPGKFWNSIRVVFGDYAFKNGKEDQEGDVVAAMLE